MSTLNIHNDKVYDQPPTEYTLTNRTHPNAPDRVDDVVPAVYSSQESDMGEVDERAIVIKANPSEQKPSGTCCGKFRRFCNKYFPFLTPKYILGLILVVIVAIIWVTASVWIQYIFGEQDFDKPYFLTYFNTTGFCFWNLGFLIMPSWRRVPFFSTKKRDDCSQTAGDELVSTVQTSCSKISIPPIYTTASNSLINTPKPPKPVSSTEPATVEEESSEQVNQPTETEVTTTTTTKEVAMYSIAELIKCAACFCIVWFLANVLFNFSLARTSVASNTILSNTSSVWTAILSYFILREPLFRWNKLLAVALSIAGGVLVTLSNSDNKDGNALSGNIMALLSAMCYALYTTILRYFCPDELRYYMGMLFGFVGIINLIWLWPGFIVLDITNVEPFRLPTRNVFFSLLLNALIGTNLSDVLWAKSVVLTSPLVATLGLTLTTPLAMIFDAVMHHQTYNAMYISGAILVSLGFIIINLTTQY